MPLSPATLELPAISSAVSIARRWLADELADWSDEGVDAAQLVISELVTNVVLHGRGPVHLAIGRHGTAVLLEVADHSIAMPAVNQYSAEATTGRGLLVVDGIALGWGVRRFPNGKGVWVALADAAIAPPRATGGVPQSADYTRGCAPPSWDPAGALALAPAIVTPAGVTELITVRILGLPIAIYQAARAHNDALIREFRWLLERGETADVPTRLLELASDIATHFAGVSDDVRNQVVAAASRGDRLVDLELAVPQTAWEVLVRFSRLLSEADDFCEQGDLLTISSSPGIRRFRSWYAAEVAAQANGAEPTPWPRNWGLDPDDDE